MKGLYKRRKGKVGACGVIGGPLFGEQTNQNQRQGKGGAKAENQGKVETPDRNLPLAETFKQNGGHQRTDRRGNLGEHQAKQVELAAHGDIRGDLCTHGAVRNADDGAYRAVKNVDHRHVDDLRHLACKAYRVPHQRDGGKQEGALCQYVWPAAAHGASGVVRDDPHERVGNGVPQFGQHQHRACPSRIDPDHIGQENQIQHGNDGLPAAEQIPGAENHLLPQGQRRLLRGSVFLL